MRNLHVRELVKLASLRAVRVQLPLTDAVSAIVAQGRARIVHILW